MGGWGELYQIFFLDFWNVFNFAKPLMLHEGSNVVFQLVCQCCRMSAILDDSPKSYCLLPGILALKHLFIYFNCALSFLVFLQTSF